MRVSVVLPVYNNEATIEKSVNSVLQQSEAQLELIIINDGSTDGTRAAISKLAEKDQRISVIDIQHSGVADAFNAGLKQAKGKYIARMDADDVMHPDRLERQATFLEVNPGIGVVSCIIEYGGDRQTQEGYARHVDWINTLITPEEIMLNRFVDSPVCNPSVMFRRELVAQHGGALTGDFPEDYEMWLRWMEAGARFAKVPELLFTWNDLPTRITRNDERYSVQAFELIKIKYLVNFITQNNPGRRPVYICGTGRITRKKSNLLVNHARNNSSHGQEITIGGYLEIDPAKWGTHYEGIPVLGLEQLPPKEKAYVINYVSVRGVREGLRNFLNVRGFEEGRDFIMAG